MRILKYENIKILKKMFFIFVFLYSLFGFNYSSADSIKPYSTPSSCSRDSECASIYGSGSCCMADIYSNTSLFNYYVCISTSKTVSSCSMYTGSVSNKCWPDIVCSNGLDYAVAGIVPINGSCGPVVGFASLVGTSMGVLNDTRITTSNKNSQFCSTGTMSSSDPKLNTATKMWTWTCSGQNSGSNATCSVNYSSVPNLQINGVCHVYSSPLMAEPTDLCVSGVSGTVVLNDGVFSWTCSGQNGGGSVSCSADAKATPIIVTPEVDPFATLVNDPLVKPATKDQTVQTEIVSSYPTIEQKPANISSYSLLEKYSTPCSIKFDSECEVLDQKLLDVVKAGMSIKDAVDSGKLNGNMMVARLSNDTPPKELDNYKTGLTLTNIQKLRKARVFPVGMELAAMCITGQIPCSDGYIYNGNSTDTADCPDKSVACHKARMSDITLTRILTGYSICDPFATGYSSKNDPFCHLVNPNWILKDPKYMCESGVKNGSLLYVTDQQSQSNIRYESCPDVSTCLTEKDNGECNAYGYCLREKNIWRFDLSADSCFSQNVGCAKYTYAMGGSTTTLGFIADTTDKSVCDQSNSGCRSYSLVKTGSASTDWSHDDSAKIFLNNKITPCDSSQEGCTAFIRRDTANLIKNSSFEEYNLSADLTTKQALLWIPHNDKPLSDSVDLESTGDNAPVYDGSNSLVMKRLSSSDETSYVGYSLNKDYFIDVEPNKTYTLSYYVLGYNTNFPADSISKYSQGAFVNVKEYDQSKNLITKQVCTSGDDTLLGSVCNSNTDCIETNNPNNKIGVCDSSSANNIIDIDALRYVNTFMSPTWTRKTVSFKTGLDTYYLDILPVLSRVKAVTDDNPVTAVFDAIQLQEGSVATTYALYENSKVNYLKKAPDYANCYSSSSDKDKIFCSNFIKSCDKKDVGCRKYEKKDNSDYWLPGKPNEENYCTAECKGYQLYKESGPSYDPAIGSTFQSLIATTAKPCSSSEAGCSQYKNLSTGGDEYFSSIRTCVKETDDIGTCKNDDSFKGNICKSDADCGAIVGSCSKATAQYTDYFTYTGSETSGYKLNVYRLLRTKACSNDKTVKCSVDSDCGSGTCSYYDDVYDPATVASSSFNACNAEAYKKQDHDPDCREFHGPSDASSASGAATGNYVLYYANMSEVIYVSDTDCSYYSIVPYQSVVSQSKCDSISYLTTGLRYNTSTNTCNIGIYIPESVTCSSDVLNCREYNGTSISSETLFTDGFEDGADGWKNSAGNAPTISTESIFVNEHSAKIAYPDYISKVVVPDIIDPKEKALYKLRLYAKNDSANGTLSSVELRVGDTFVSTKQINNDWKFIGFDVFSSSNLTTVLNSIQISNKGLVNNGGAVNLFVDYISVEKSSSIYVIKNSWTTPVSCDNDISNPTGACNAEGVANGFCTMVPNKVCLTGTNVGAVCTDATVAADCGDVTDTCTYANKVCRWGDNKNSSCNSDDDCYNNPTDPVNVAVKTGSCFYTTNGYRLNLGKMIGCDEYIDSYSNDEFYVFNDLNLCSADKMGCEALYDTKNSKSYQSQEFNKNVDYSSVVAYYTFDDKNNIAKNDFSSNLMTNNNNVVYVKDGVSAGAALFNGTNNISEVINDSLKSVTSNVSIYSWVRPNSFGGSIVSLGNYYNLSILPDGEVQCVFNNDNTQLLKSGSNYLLTLNKWQNVLCVYDGDRIKMYINGELVSSSGDVTMNFNYGTDATSLLKIGSGLVGSIDDLRIYSKFFDSKAAYDSYNDYKDNYTVGADELGYYIIDSNYSCDAKYKGCTAVGRSDDRYDSPDFDYSTAYFVIDPDKFKSSGNYSTTGVYDATMCTAEEAGCYSFQDSKGASVNFKFPKSLCVYKTNVDVGVSDTNTGTPKLQTGWFKYDVKSKSISDEGCYYADVLGSNTDATSVSAAKINPDSYKIVKASDCEYRKDPVVIRRTFESTTTNGVTTTTTRPKQTTYYIYTGTCSDGSGINCSDDTMCSSGYCLLERTNTKCASTSGDPYCKPYGYDENPGIIDQFSNKSFEFNVCQGGNKVGSYCSVDNDCPGSTCDAPWTVIGWFKKNSTKGCSDNGLECVGGTKTGNSCVSDSDCVDNNGVVDGVCKDVIEASDYMRNYNGAVGICNEYDCTNFIEPTEKSCKAGNLDGYDCSSDNDCGENGVCVTDDVNGSKYCKAKVDGTPVNKLNLPCVFDKDCGFGGVCVGNNIYSYINNSKINSAGCNGKVSRESGCALFDDTSNPLLNFSSKLTYAGVKNGIAVSAVTGDNSGGDSQKDSNLIIKVNRDRECSEWITFDSAGSPTKQDFDPAAADSTNNTMSTCKELSQNNKCLDGQHGSGWSGSLSTDFYIKQMNGNWFNEDFSGMAIPLEPSIDNSSSSWWKNASVGSNSILSSNASNADHVICKSYPETDSPFNFIDKYNLNLVDCTCDSTIKIGEQCTASGNDKCLAINGNPTKLSWINGKITYLTYDQFKSLTPKDYFKNVNSGITIPYATNSSGTESDKQALYRIDNNQDCYYQKVNYKDVLNPRQQYFGNGLSWNLPASIYVDCTSSDVVDCNAKSLESKVADYTDSKLKYKGYCAEYDYSHEIYYPGSGKYNCLTWIPGFINQ